MKTVLAVAVLGLMVAGCQGSQAPAPAAALQQVGSLTTKLKAEGDDLMAQHEYEKAAVKYQAALNEAPADIPIRFAFATALSYLPRREETVEQFRIVMQRGVPGSAEVRAAREWLANAEELGAGEAGAPAASAQATAVAAGNQGPTTGPGKRGKVAGKLSWQGIEPRAKMVRVNISLTGDESETREIRLGREFKIGRGYEFRDVPQGSYRLVAEAGGTTMWDMKVQVPGDRDLTLDLGESNAAVAASFSPPSD
jgi:hypothetical protein